MLLQHRSPRTAARPAAPAGPEPIRRSRHAASPQLPQAGRCRRAWRSAPFPTWPRHSPPAPASALKPTQQPSAFVQIAANGEVTVTINRLEFGQGVQTALPMILAEELDADWNLVRSRHGSNDAAYVDPLFGIHLTGGSHSVKNSFTQYRELGARARAMLLGCRRGALERGRGHPAHAGRHGAGPGWPQAGLRRIGRGRHGPARAGEGHAEGSQGLPHHRPPHHAPGRACQEQRAPGLRHRRSPARAADGGGGPSAGVRRAPRIGGRQRGARRQGREGRAARAAGSRRRRRGRGGRRLLAGQAGPRGAEAAVGHVGRGEGGQRTATGRVPRAGRSPRRAQVRRRHGAARPRRPGDWKPSSCSPTSPTRRWSR